MDFSYIDLVILIPLLYGMYKGFTKGLILSLATLLGLFLGIYGGVKFSHITAQFLLRYFEIDVPLIAFSVTFLMLLVGVYLLGKILSKFIDVLALGFFNKVAGALFGVSKVVLILLVLLLFFENINQKFSLVGEDEIVKSQLYTFLKQTSEIVFPYFEEFKENTIN
ncbi:MAG: colicin V production protein [Flavobacteriales bacterium]|nr:colicin V production protein [Flavobacteriales bacterium]MBO73532.1 colicin V production protein [Flavobacteriales bacterium]|tara:strand:- start:597 stop:1094 length:498 start_codon:yes stop_codon:yes gene_type:complete